MGSTNLGKSDGEILTAEEINALLAVVAGKVGIGTESPVEALEVAGNIKADNFIGDGSGLTGIGAGTGGIINTGSTTIGADSDIDGVGVIALQTKGVTRVEIENDGSVVINESGADVDFRVESDTNIYALFVQGSDGNVGIGTIPLSAKLAVNGGIITTGGINAHLTSSGALEQNGNKTAIRAYGATAGQGHIGLNVGGGGGSADFEAVRIDPDGNVGIGTSAPNALTKLDVAGKIRASTGILFGTDTADASTLDDYEEGTWTPSFNGYSTGITGKYTKIGNKLTITIDKATSILAGSIVGPVIITGLPFTVSGSEKWFGPVGHIRGATAGATNRPVAMVGLSGIGLFTDDSFGSVSYTTYTQANWDGSIITQNGTTTVILHWSFTFTLD